MDLVALLRELGQPVGLLLIGAAGFAWMAKRNGGGENGVAGTLSRERHDAILRGLESVAGDIRASTGAMQEVARVLVAHDASAQPAIRASLEGWRQVDAIHRVVVREAEP